MMLDYREPWEIGYDTTEFASVDDRDGCSVLDPASSDDAKRIVACVNAMAGLDPVNVRAFMDVFIHTECIDLFDKPCGDCWTCRARACREDADA